MSTQISKHPSKGRFYIPCVRYDQFVAVGRGAREKAVFPSPPSCPQHTYILIGAVGLQSQTAFMLIQVPPFTGSVHLGQVP